MSVSVQLERVGGGAMVWWRWAYPGTPMQLAAHADKDDDEQEDGHENVNEQLGMEPAIQVHDALQRNERELAKKRPHVVA